MIDRQRFSCDVNGDKTVKIAQEWMNKNEIRVISVQEFPGSYSQLYEIIIWYEHSVIKNKPIEDDYFIVEYEDTIGYGVSK